MQLELECECRQCGPCLKKRGSRWRMRARAEYAAAARTWLGTLTFAPDAHARVLAAVRQRCARKGIDFDTLSDAERWTRQERMAFREVQLWLKRVLKNSKAQVRRLAICERHKSGLPHYHVLIHEVDAARPVRHRTLKQAWWPGFSDFGLVTSDIECVYGTKYLTKSLEARVRASKDYGKSPSLACASLLAGSQHQARNTRQKNADLQRTP